MVLDCRFVEPVVVDVKSKTSILLQCKQHLCSIGGYRWSDVAVLKHVLNLFLRLLELEWAKFVDWPVDGWSIILQFNLELISHLYWW